MSVGTRLFDKRVFVSLTSGRDYGEHLCCGDGSLPVSYGECYQYH